VFYSSSFNSPYFLYLASIVFSPTAHTIALPYPAITFESANRNGSGWDLWLSKSWSKFPSLDSSLLTLFYFLKYMLWSTIRPISSIKIQSAGILSP
jgi:hypothetical protein